MPARALDSARVAALLNEIVGFELAGVVRYTHYSLMVGGPHRIPIVAFLKQQASESLLHAQRTGEILTGLGGHPSMRIAKLEETHQHSLRDLLAESLVHERRGVDMYRDLLDLVEGASVYLEEFARSMIAAEEEGAMAFTKMLRDFGSEPAAGVARPHAKRTPRRRGRAAG